MAAFFPAAIAVLADFAVVAAISPRFSVAMADFLLQSSAATGGCHDGLAGVAGIAGVPWACSDAPS
jgi:hypothetical protein